jgi:hypothetical protein
MSKIIYHYHPLTGELLGAGEADVSPLEPDAFIIPAHATDIEPPAVSANEAAVFTAGAWQAVADFRGQTFFDVGGNPVKIESLGDVPVILASTVPATIALERAKAIKTVEINAACTTTIVGGFASSALGAPHTYDSALEDQLNLIGAVGLGIDLPYRCADATGVKEFRLHTSTQLKQVAADGAMVKLAALEKAATLKAQVQAAADAAAVEAVAW